MKYNKTYVILIIAVVFAVLLYILAPILTPFLAGALLAYLGNPLVELLVNHRVPRLLSVIIVFVSLFLIIILSFLLLIPVLQNQLSIIIEEIPNMISWTQTRMIPWITEHVGIKRSVDITALKTTIATNLAKTSGIASWILATVLASGRTLVEWVTNLMIIPVVTFYLLRDWNKIIKNCRGLLPRHIEPTVVKLVRESDIMLSAFFRGQLLVMLSLGIMYSVGLTLLGVQFGVVIGLLSGLASIVPYLGFIVGIVAASIAAYVQYDTFLSVLLVWGVFAIGQAIESGILTPKLVGSRIGLHPVAVIFAVLAGGMLFGFFGVLLALPAAAVIMVCLRHLNKRYRASQLYK